MTNTITESLSEHLSKNPAKLSLKFLLKKTLSILIVLPLLASCSGNYTFESNVKPDNANGYFSASKVEIFKDETEFMSSFQYVGLVEGEDC